MKKIRFAFIEAMILEHGSIQRCHLCRAFGIKAPTATRIFREYRNAHPDNLKFEPSSKSYQLNKGFEAFNLGSNPDVFLKAAQVMSENIIIQHKLA